MPWTGVQRLTFEGVAGNFWNKLPVIAQRVVTLGARPGLIQDIIMGYRKSGGNEQTVALRLLRIGLLPQPDYLNRSTLSCLRPPTASHMTIAESNREPTTQG